MPASDRDRGLYQKYSVQKVDANGNIQPMERPTFVLDYTKDPHAAVALLAYAKSCEREYPKLASDLMRELRFQGADFE